MDNQKQRWIIYEDEYWDTEWNDRRDIDDLDGTIDEVVDDLLSRFRPEYREYVEVDDSDFDIVCAYIDVCVQCGKVATLCECEDSDYVREGFTAIMEDEPSSVIQHQ